ncbi:LPS export ABC transporter periplasmic protein LptC [Ancylobacter pratisalsi]|uniref:LPS export ABC transporter periplasmic protein LptC n=1 Tax=Ancylobacter pratisalsi TaxID=1745854 RepID=UPI001FE6A2F5|nr:LPS export ABC transporter periplasmic protein LptC [Ancylobacter pratisalsi]
MARRHSSFVRFFRWALPVGVLLVLGAVFLSNYLNPFRLAVDLPFELGRVSLSGTQVMMELPRLHGFTADNRGYDVSAKSATQDLTQPNQIDLNTIEAKLELADKGWASLTASTGRYDTKTEQLVLADGVRFDTSAGYSGQLKEAAIDIQGGRMVSEHPVVLTYLDGKLTADRMEVTQKDSRALLTGHVRLDFRMPPPGEDKKSDTSGSAAPVLRGANAGGLP